MFKTDKPYVDGRVQWHLGLILKPLNSIDLHVTKTNCHGDKGHVLDLGMVHDSWVCINTNSFEIVKKKKSLQIIPNEKSF